MTVWSIMLQALKQGHTVRVGAFSYPTDQFLDSNRLDQVANAGASVNVVKLSDKRTISKKETLTSSIRSVFSDQDAKAEIIRDIENFSPDAIFLYHWDSIASLHGYKKFPKLGIAGDPWHLPGLRNWQQLPFSPSPRYLKLAAYYATQSYFAPRAMARILQDCDSYGSFQAEEASHMKKRGASNCKYYRTCVADPIELLDDSTPPLGDRDKSIPKILLGPSNIEASSTKAAVSFFAKDVYPHLKAIMGDAPFVVRVVGEGKAPKELADLLPSPHFELPGRIEPPDDEFLNATVQIVCTPFVLGIRVRIITGFAYGCCVVAHLAEKANIPELEDGKNCLIGKDGKTIAEKIAFAITNPERRQQIQQTARSDYDTLFSPTVAASAVVTELERISTKR